MDFDSIKGMFNSLVGTVSEKGREVAGVAVDKGKAAGRVAKLTLELNSEKEALKKAYAEIGQTYFENYRAGAQGLLSQLCEEAEAVSGRIAEMEAELAGLKTEFTPPIEVEVNFEKVVEEAEKEASETIEDAAETLHEIVNDDTDE